MKRIADTSRAAFGALSEMPTRAADVFVAVQRFRLHHQSDPTAYELLRWMQIERPILDLNAVRPRLTELRDAGYMATRDKRVCAVTGKRVYTWAVVAPILDQAPFRDEARDLPVLQESLF